MPEIKEIIVELYTNTLSPGMILKGDCYDESGVKVIDMSKPVTKEEIQALKLRNIRKIYYRTSRISVKNGIENSIISDQSIGQAMSVMQDIQNQLMHNKLSVPVKELRKVVDNFVQEINENKSSYLNLLEVSDLDEYTYSHAINVSTISIMMGIALNLDAQKVYNLGISGLLMDIGKSFIPKETLFKQGPLTEDEKKLIRNHPVYGFNMLKTNQDLNKEILDGVLLHHEYYLGGGYPFNFNREKLSYLPQILSISDAFDAGTSQRPYRSPNSYPQMISFLMQNSGKMFNPIYTQIFLNHMIKKIFDKPLYYIGAYVLLNTNEIAYVVDHLGEPFTLKPVINIIFNPALPEKVLKYHQQINLEKDITRQIIRRIDDMASVEKLIRIECKGNIDCIYEKQQVRQS